MPIGRLASFLVSGATKDGAAIRRKDLDDLAIDALMAALTIGHRPQAFVRLGATASIPAVSIDQ